MTANSWFSGKKTYIAAGLTAVVGLAGMFGIYFDPALAQQIATVGLALSAMALRNAMKQKVIKMSHYSTGISQTSCCSGTHVFACLTIGFLIGAGIARGQRKKDKRKLEVIKF